MFIEPKSAVFIPSVGNLAYKEGRERGDAEGYHDVSVRIYRPKNRESDVLPAVVYFHGGGWVLGDIDIADSAVANVCQRTQAVCISLNYSLSPEAAFPMALNECVAVTTYVFEHAQKFQIDPQRIAVAEGYRERLQATLSSSHLSCDRLSGTDTASYKESGCGAYNLTTHSMRYFHDQYCPDVSQRSDPDVSPFMTPIEGLKNLSPALVVTIEADPLRDEGEAYDRRMIEAGVQVQMVRVSGVAHVFGDVPVRIYRPKGREAQVLPAVVFFHGGGWVSCDLDEVDAFVSNLCQRTQAIYISVDYSLSPEVRFPVAVNECDGVVSYVFEHAQELQVDGKRIAVAGDSAGGNLAAVMARKATEKGHKLCFQALIFPVTDCTRTDTASYKECGGGAYFLTTDSMRFCINEYAPDETLRSDPDMSPLLAPLEALKSLPPALVLTIE
ncbi:hypothetical protein BZG36_03293, partial [Bifiguratus adelaidae]